MFTFLKRRSFNLMNFNEILLFNNISPDFKSSFKSFYWFLWFLKNAINFGKRFEKNIWSCLDQCTEVRFASLLSSGFTTMTVINPPDWKLANCTFVQWSNLYFSANSQPEIRILTDSTCGVCWNAWQDWILSWRFHYTLGKYNYLH